MIKVILQHIAYKLFYYHHKNLKIKYHYIHAHRLINLIQINSMKKVIGLNFILIWPYLYLIVYIFYLTKLNLNFDIYL